MSSKACKHCGHHDESPVKRMEEEDEIREDKPDNSHDEDANKSHHHDKLAKNDSKKVEKKKTTTTKKPEFHSEVYTESSSYVMSNGHYKKEVHAEHKLDGKTIFKKDLIDNDGKVSGNELEWDRDGHKHIKPIANSRV